MAESQASVSIRLNPFKGCEGPEGAPVPWSPYGRMLAERPVFTLDPLFHAGCYYVQDSSAMFVGHVFRKVLAEVLKDKADSPVRVLDLCAAPGGKTTDLAASLREVAGSNFLLVANEVMKSRVGILADNVARWGDPNVLVTSVDPAAFAQLGAWFDIIVADVPCSGEGMFRKDERAREEWSPEVVQLCAARQKRILADVWPALKSGGHLVYSTCTYEDCENDENLEWAASELGGTVLNPTDEFAQYGVQTTRAGNLLKVGMVPGEGQWAGALQKTAEAPQDRKADISILRPRRLYQAAPAAKQDRHGKPGADSPDPDLPLSIDFADAYPTVDVDLATALKYLHRDALVLPDAPKGLIAVAYHGHPLGFAKNIGSRCNNLLPQGRRILMDIK